MVRRAARDCEPHTVPANQLIYIAGTSGADDIEGNTLGDVICALGGDDFVKGNAGNDIIYGGSPAPTRSTHTLHGGGLVPSPIDLADQLKGGKGDDTMFGGDGFDDLHGNDGVDSGGDGQAGSGNCDAPVEAQVSC